MKKTKLDITHAKKMYYSSVEGFRDIALEYYTEEQLKRPALPTSWEELSSEQLLEFSGISIESTAINTIRALLKVYNGDWAGNWGCADSDKWIIHAFAGRISRHDSWDESALLSFKTESKRDHFLANHLALIKQAAPLLWGVSFEVESKEVERVCFVVNYGNHLHIGKNNQHTALETLISSCDWFNLPSEANDKRNNNIIPSDSLSVQKLTIYKDGTHRLEAVQTGADEEQ